MNKNKSIALTVDVEGEWFELPGEQGTFDVARVKFAVEHLEQLLIQIEDELGVKVPVTWFVRCDDSVEQCTGEISGLLRALDGFISRRIAIGDDFGLHPHLYEFQNGKWVSEKNATKQCEQLERAAVAWEAFFGSSPDLSRMGEAVMNNTLASGIEKLGIKCDSSALSGRKRFDNGFQFDWVNTPNLPYHPSLVDYRRANTNNESSYGFTEIPFTMLPILGPFDKQPLHRYCNLAFRPELIECAINNMMIPDKIIAVVHPHELLLSKNSHPLIANKPASLKDNLTLLHKKTNADFTLLKRLVEN